MTGANQPIIVIIKDFGQVDELRPKYVSCFSFE